MRLFQIAVASLALATASLAGESLNVEFSQNPYIILKVSGKTFKLVSAVKSPNAPPRGSQSPVDYNYISRSTTLSNVQVKWLRDWVARNDVFALEPVQSHGAPHYMSAGPARLAVAEGQHKHQAVWTYDTKTQKLTTASQELVDWALKVAKPLKPTKD